MCYADAAAAQAAGIEALRHGILLLLFPPLVLFAAILAAALKKRNRFAEGRAHTMQQAAGRKIRVTN